MQIFANLARICWGGFVDLPLHQTGGVMQRLAEEFHKLLVAGSNPAPVTDNSMPMRTKYEDDVMDGARFMRKQFLQTLITLRDG